MKRLIAIHKHSIYIPERHYDYFRSMFVRTEESDCLQWLFRRTGGVQKKSYPCDKAFTVFSPALESTIVHLVLMRPGIIISPW